MTQGSARAEAPAVPSHCQSFLAFDFGLKRTGVAIGTRMLRDVLDAFARLDPVDAARIIREDATVDDHFRGIMRQLITYMMEDPRMISASLDLLFLAKAIERIGDHSKNIAEQIIYIVKGADVRHSPMNEIESVVK